MKDFFQSQTFSRILIVLGILVVMVVIFWAGTLVGYREAQFSYEWDSNYARQFGSPRSPFVLMMDHDDSAMNANGAFGQIVGVRLPEIVIKGPSEVEKTVIVGTSTVIRQFHSSASTTNLMNGETVVVIGEPDSQGDIQAALIRIVPPPPTVSGTSSTIPYSASSSSTSK